MYPVEALADAIMCFEGWHPKGESQSLPNGSRSWRNRNPGNLRPFSSSQARDSENYRIFASLVDGFSALLADLNHKLQIDFSQKDTLLDVISKYAPAGDANNPTTYTIFVCHRLTLNIGRVINPTTTIGELLYGLPQTPKVSVRA